MFWNTKFTFIYLGQMHRYVHAKNATSLPRK